jgi:hypothetical protein
MKTLIRLYRLFDYAYPNQEFARRSTVLEWIEKYNQGEPGVLRMFEVNNICR